METVQGPGSGYQGYRARPAEQAGKPARPALEQRKGPRDSLTGPGALENMIRQARETQTAGEKYRKLYKVKAQRYGDAPLEAYARLAKARNSYQISAAAGYATRAIGQLRQAQRGDKEHAAEIRAAIAQLKKVSGRASKKRRGLENEKLLEQRRQRAQEEERRQFALRLRTELQRKRTARALGERAYQHEASADGMFHARMAQELAKYSLSGEANAATPGSVGESAVPAAVEGAAAGGSISVVV